jgi:FkbM family methyltransferase
MKILGKFTKLKVTNILKFNFAKIFKINNYTFSTKFGKIYLDLKNPGISKTIAYYGTREEEKLFLIKEILNEGDATIDCGSNIGIYPIYINQLIGREGYICMIEPDKRNISTLNKNTKLLTCNHSLVEGAISDKTYTGKLFESDYTNLNSLDSINTPGKNFSSQEVQVISIKDLIKKLPIDKRKFKLLRMDIEGGEVEVLKSIIESFNDISISNILFENHPVQYNKKKNLMIDLLKTFIKNKYSIDVLVSAGSNNSSEFEGFEYRPYKILESDGRYRGLFKNIDPYKAIELIIKTPKLIRYVLLKKND